MTREPDFLSLRTIQAKVFALVVPLVLLSTAAEQGHAKAQAHLGGMYIIGQSVPQDYVQGYMWLALAAAQRLESAQNSVDIFAKRMTPEQLAEAKRLAREWKPKK